MIDKRQKHFSCLSVHPGRSTHYNAGQPSLEISRLNLKSKYFCADIFKTFCGVLEPQET